MEFAQLGFGSFAQGLLTTIIRSDLVLPSFLFSFRAIREMPSYKHERESVQRIRSMRNDYSDRRRQEEVNEKLQEETGPTAAQQLAPINATYGDIMQLIGPTNYPAMLELFRGSNGLPGGVHPEVTVSFELFEAIQERLVSTRDELDGTKRELLAKAQQLSAVQAEMARCSDRNTALSRDLKQAEDLCLELRKYSSDASILKQQHENEVIGFKDEIAGLVSRLNLSEKQVTESHYKVSEALVHLAQKDAVIASLKRTARPSIAPGGCGESQDDVAPSHHRKSTLGGIDRVFQDQLKQHISQVEKEKRSLEGELRDVLEMHEGYRHHVETVIRQYESQYMFYEDCFGSHMCNDRFAPASNEALASHSSSMVWEASARKPITSVQQLLEMCEGGLVAIERISDAGEDSTFKMQVSQCKDGAVSLMRASVESVRLLHKLDGHMSSVVSIGELRDTWRRVQSQWVDHIRRQVASGVTAASFGLDSVLENERVFRAHAEQSIEDRWMRVISEQYKLIVPTRDSAVQGSVRTTDATHQAGAAFFVNRVNVACATTLRAAVENRTAQTDRSGTPSVDLSVHANGNESMGGPQGHELDLSVRSNATPQLSKNVPSKFCAMHNSCLQLAKVIRKLYASGKKSTIIDPLVYLKQLDTSLAPESLEEVMELDTQLIKALTACMSEDPDAEMRFDAYQCRAEIHRLDKTVDAVGKIPPTRFVDEATRADVSGYQQTRARLVADVSAGTAFDEGSLQKKIRLLLQSDKTAVVMTAASREAVSRAPPLRHSSQNGPPTSPSRRKDTTRESQFNLSVTESSHRGSTLGNSSRFGDGQEDDAGETEYESRGAVTSAVNTALSISVPSAPSTRRNPFRRTAEDAVVEQVRATTPATHLPTLSAKMEEAAAFADGRRPRYHDGEPMWSSASAGAAASRRSVSPARSVSPSMFLDGMQLSRRDSPSSTLLQQDNSEGVAIENAATDAAGSKGSLDHTPSPPPATPPPSLIMTAAPTRGLSPSRVAPLKPLPKAPPSRPVLQSPTRGPKGGFNVIDQHIFHIQPKQVAPQGGGRGEEKRIVVEGTPQVEGSPPTSPRDNQQSPISGAHSTAPHSRASSVDSIASPTMPRTETMLPSVVASQKKQRQPSAPPTEATTQQHAGDSTGPTMGITNGVTSADVVGEVNKRGATATPTKHQGKGSGAAPASPRAMVSHRQTTSSGAGRLTAAQIIEQARQEQKRMMMGQGPLSLGPQVLMHSGGGAGAGGGGSRGPNDHAKVRLATSPEVTSPPTTAPSGVSRSTSDVLRVVRKGGGVGRRGGEDPKSLTSIGMPVGSNAGVDAALAMRGSPPPMRGGSPTLAARNGVTSSPHRRLPTAPIEGIFGSLDDDERRPVSPQRPLHPHQDDELRPFAEEYRPTTHPLATHVPVGNPDTSVYRQRVHGLVPRRPTGTDILNDLLRKQRSDTMDLSVTDFSINGTVARVTTVPSTGQRRSIGRIGSVASPPEDVLNGSIGPFASGDTPKANNEAKSAKEK